MSLSPPMIGHDEPPAVSIDRQSGSSPFVILCDHAGNRLPRALGMLGLTAPDLLRHITWDIGAYAVASRLRALLDATLVAQQYSRLAIDCNRSPESAASIVARSEDMDIPGNVGLDAGERLRRQAAIFEPYHRAIASLLEERRAQHRPTIIIAQHSFTPVFHGIARPWGAGMLYDRDARLGRALGKLLRAEGVVVGDNEPYRLDPDIDYTIPFHAEAGGLPYIEIEIRQDLIAEGSGQAEWADRLRRLLPVAAAGL